MRNGVLQAWEHPLVPLLWLEVGCNKRKLKQLAGEEYAFFSVRTLCRGAERAYNTELSRIAQHKDALTWLAEVAEEEETVSKAFGDTIRARMLEDSISRNYLDALLKHAPLEASPKSLPDPWATMSKKVKKK